MLVLHSFILPTNYQLYGYVTFYLSSSVDGHLGCFHFPDIMNNATMNIHGQVLYGRVFVSLG